MTGATDERSRLRSIRQLEGSAWLETSPLTASPPATVIEHVGDLPRGYTETDGQGVGLRFADPRQLFGAGDGEHSAPGDVGLSRFSSPTNAITGSLPVSGTAAELPQLADVGPGAPGSSVSAHQEVTSVIDGQANRTHAPATPQRTQDRVSIESAATPEPSASATTGTPKPATVAKTARDTAPVGDRTWSGDNVAGSPRSPLLTTPSGTESPASLPASPDGDGRETGTAPAETGGIGPTFGHEVGVTERPERTSRLRSGPVDSAGLVGGHSVAEHADRSVPWPPSRATTAGHQTEWPGQADSSDRPIRSQGRSRSTPGSVVADSGKSDPPSTPVGGNTGDRRQGSSHGSVDTTRPGYPNPSGAEGTVRGRLLAGTADPFREPTESDSLSRQTQSDPSQSTATVSTDRVGLVTAGRAIETVSHVAGLDQSTAQQRTHAARVTHPRSPAGRIEGRPVGTAPESVRAEPRSTRSRSRRFGGADPAVGTGAIQRLQRGSTVQSDGVGPRHSTKRSDPPPTGSATLPITAGVLGIASWTSAVGHAERPVASLDRTSAVDATTARTATGNVNPRSTGGSADTRTTTRAFAGTEPALRGAWSSTTTGGTGPSIPVERTESTAGSTWPSPRRRHDPPSWETAVDSRPLGNEALSASRMGTRATLTGSRAWTGLASPATTGRTESSTETAASTGRLTPQGSPSTASARLSSVDSQPWTATGQPAAKPNPSTPESVGTHRRAVRKRADQTAGQRSVNRRPFGRPKLRGETPGHRPPDASTSTRQSQSVVSTGPGIEATRTPQRLGQDELDTSVSRAIPTPDRTQRNRSGLSTHRNPATSADRERPDGTTRLSQRRRPTTPMASSMTAADQAGTPTGSGQSEPTDSVGASRGPDEMRPQILGEPPSSGFRSTERTRLSATAGEGRPSRGHTDGGADIVGFAQAAGSGAISGADLPVGQRRSTITVSRLPSTAGSPATDGVLSGRDTHTERNNATPNELTRGHPSTDGTPRAATTEPSETPMRQIGTAVASDTADTPSRSTVDETAAHSTIEATSSANASRALLSTTQDPSLGGSRLSGTATASVSDDATPPEGPERAPPPLGVSGLPSQAAGAVTDPDPVQPTPTVENPGGEDAGVSIPVGNGPAAGIESAGIHTVGHRGVVSDPRVQASTVGLRASVGQFTTGTDDDTIARPETAPGTHTAVETGRGDPGDTVSPTDSNPDRIPGDRSRKPSHTGSGGATSVAGGQSQTDSSPGLGAETTLTHHSDRLAWTPTDEGSQEGGGDHPQRDTDQVVNPWSGETHTTEFDSHDATQQETSRAAESDVDHGGSGDRPAGRDRRPSTERGDRSMTTDERSMVHPDEDRQWQDERSGTDRGYPGADHEPRAARTRPNGSSDSRDRAASGADHSTGNQEPMLTEAVVDGLVEKLYRKLERKERIEHRRRGL